MAIRKPFATTASATTGAITKGAAMMFLQRDKV
jgi:hypothetical protein